jgi:hypothetical protein
LGGGLGEKTIIAVKAARVMEKAVVMRQSWHSSSKRSIVTGSCIVVVIVALDIVGVDGGREHRGDISTSPWLKVSSGRVVLWEQLWT